MCEEAVWVSPRDLNRHQPVACVNMQTNRFGRGARIYPKPVFIMDEAEGADLGRSLKDAGAITIKGHGIVTVGKTIDGVEILRVEGEKGRDLA